MRRARGFKVKTKLVKIYNKWVKSRPARRRSKRNPITKVIHLARCLRKRAFKKLNSFKPSLTTLDRGYAQLRTPESDDPGCGIPKGHLAVYVGESQDEAQRYLVPVIYFNHPLFGELLKEAERVYGFDHPGRITIPCEASEFEKVQMRIASADQHHGLQMQLHRRRFKHRRHYWLL